MNLKSISYREKLKNEVAPILKYSLLVSVVPQILWIWNTFSGIGTSFERSNDAARHSVLIDSIAKHVNRRPQTDGKYVSDTFRRTKLDLVKITNELSIHSPQFLELLSLHKKITEILQDLKPHNRMTKLDRLDELSWKYSEAIQKIIATYETKIRQEELKLRLQVLILGASVAGLALLFFLGEMRQIDAKSKQNEIFHPSDI